MFMPWLVFFPLISCPAFTWDGIYTGATATKPMRDSNIGCVAAFFAVWLIGSLLIDSPVPASGVGAYGAAGALDAASVAGAHLLFAAYYAHLIYRSLYQTFHYKKSILNPLLIS